MDALTLTRYLAGALDFFNMDDLVLNSDPLATLDETQCASGRVGGSGGGKVDKAVFVLCLVRPGYKTRRFALAACACSIDEERHLVPTPGETPFFNHRFFEDSLQDSAFSIGESSRDGEFRGTYPPPLAAEWPPLWTWMVSLLCAVTETRTFAEAEAELGRRAEEAVAYGKSSEASYSLCGLIYEATSEKGATINTRALGVSLLEGWDYARIGETVLAAFESNGGLRSTRNQWGTDGICGHMDERSGPGRVQFPLDASQRSAVRHLGALAPGEAQAVNGPPGTGKTSMLKAAIASRWVQAVIRGEDCPVTVACGATNQSVTNVIRAFGDVHAEEHGGCEFVLGKRWIPSLVSYGSFFPSKSYLDKKPETANLFQVIREDREGALYEFVGRKPVFSAADRDARESDYLDFFREIFPQKNGVTTLADAIATLREQVIDWGKMFPALLARHLHAGDGASAFVDRETLRARLNPFGLVYNDAAAQAVDDLLELLFAPHSAGAQALVAGAIEDGQDGQAARQMVLEKALDCSLRPLAFHAAARYWEGRFIASLGTRLFSRSERNVTEGLRRLCMITPCLVTTLNMAPKLARLEALDPDMPRRYAFGVIDMLIIDEAGQALPEIGIPVLALAKRAAAVGDRLQLAPIWTLDTVRDVALFGRCGLSDRIDRFMDAGVSASCGSVLTAVRGVARYNEVMDRGITLRYHYRCHPDIIEYCNILCYGGTLIAKTSRKLLTATEAGKTFPAMSWVDCGTEAKKQSGSWVNEEEARQIGSWIVTNWPALKEATGKTALKETIAVVTPFKPQVERIYTALKERMDPEEAEAAGLDDMIIGTVHSLQGAECPVVIFSSVFSGQGSRLPFFDKGTELLNVAVSRAKSCFLCFGEAARFGFTRPEPLPSDLRELRDPPSRLLGRHMANIGAKRLFPNVLVIVEAPGKVESISHYLGLDYQVLATGGAVAELGLDHVSLSYADGLIPHHQLSATGQDAIARICLMAKGMERIVIATDADLMGEEIAWHVETAIGQCSPEWAGRIERVRLGAITRERISEAFGAKKEPQRLDQSVVAAALLREVIDILVARRLGHVLAVGREDLSEDEPGNTPEDLAARADAAGLLAQPPSRGARNVGMGRVQAGVLALMLRHLRGELQTDGLWDVGVTVTASAGGQGRQSTGGSRERPWTITGRLMRQGGIALFEEPAARDMAQRLQKTSGHLRETVTQRVEMGPAPAAGTAFLLAEAWRRRGIAPREAMACLQRLYEGEAGVKGNTRDR